MARRFDPAASAAQITSVRQGKKEERRKLDALFAPFLEGTKSKKTLTTPKVGGFEQQSPRNFGSSTEQKSKKHGKHMNCFGHQCNPSSDFYKIALSSLFVSFDKGQWLYRYGLSFCSWMGFIVDFYQFFCIQVRVNLRRD
jgi:hypothetical protein